MPSPPARPSIKIVQNVPRRSGTIDTSNRFFLAHTGTAFTTAQWNALVADLVTHLKSALDSARTFVEAVCYDAGTDVPVLTIALSGAGTGSWPTGIHLPSDCAAVLRFATDARTTKNHPIYLFKYFHNVKADTSINVDELDTNVVGTLNTFGTWCLTGPSDGTTAFPVCGPRGAVAQSRHVLPEVRHRDFPN